LRHGFHGLTRKGDLTELGNGALGYVMRYSLLPDPGRINPGFMLQDRVTGIGQPTDTPASGNVTQGSGTNPTFLSSLGTTFLDLTRQYAPGLINWGITGNAPQSVVTTNPQTGQASIVTIPGGTQTLAKATGSLPTWAVPAMIAGGVALLFFATRKK
jgi:hypothetical protein